MKFLIIVFLLLSLSANASVEELATSPDTFAVCKTVDIASTAYLLKIGVATEANPLVAPLIANGVFPLVLISASVYWLMQHYNNPTANVVTNGVTCGVALQNLLLIP